MNKYLPQTSTVERVVLHIINCVNIKNCFEMGNLIGSNVTKKDIADIKMYLISSNSHKQHIIELNNKIIEQNNTIIGLLGNSEMFNETKRNVYDKS